jgi:hypothetical protein
MIGGPGKRRGDLLRPDVSSDGKRRDGSRTGYRLKILGGLTLISQLAIPAAVSSQDATIDWWSVDGGGEIQAEGGRLGPVGHCRPVGQHRGQPANRRIVANDRRFLGTRCPASRHAVRR